MEQVAEFCTSDLTTYRFAWVMCYLAGMYRQTWINLEINGPGEAVLSELGELRRRSRTVLPTGEMQREGDVRNFLAHVRYYLYQRLDSVGGGGYMYHWKTTPASKERMLNVFRDLVEKRTARIHSLELCDEMLTVVREESGDIKGSGRAKDDRVIAAALAGEQYVRAMRWPLENMGITWGAEMTRRMKREMAGGVDIAPDTTSLGKNVRTFLKRIGMQQEGRRYG
jgi:hypothetical protein